MAIIQSAFGSTAGGNSAVATFGADTHTGNAIIAVFCCFYVGSPYTTLSDNSGSSFPASPGDVNAQYEGTIIIATAFGITGRSGHAVTATLSANYYILRVFEVSGISALDQVHGNAGVQANYSSGATATTTDANEYLFGAHGMDNLNSLAATPASGWNSLGQVTDGSFHRLYCQDRDATSQAAYTSNGTGDVFYKNVIATYRLSGSPPAGALLKQSKLVGLGSGGTFFQNPLN